MDTSRNILGERRTYSDHAHTHDHPFAQLLLPLQGSLFIETSIYQFELDHSHLFFLPPQCQHTFYAKTNNEFLVLDIPSSLLVGNSNPFQGGLGIELDDRWQAIRLLLLAEVDQSTANQDLTDLFQYAYRLLSKRWVPRSLQYIHAHYHESLEVQKLAELEGYNLTYYCDWFKKLTRTTPKHYIQTMRLKKAKELLASTDLPILQIAQQVGYDHHSSFTRLFQQFEKVTPVVYRQQIRNKEKEDQKLRKA